LKEEFISKTALLYLERCNRAFYLYKRFPWLRPKPDAKKQFLLNRGTDLGIIARHLYPGGIDASEKSQSFNEACKKTQALIQNKVPVIYEASMEWNGAGAMADILINTDEGWKIIEIKSSAQVYHHHVLDAAFQYFIFSKHLPVTEIFVAIPDKNYVYHQRLDVQKLFKKVSVTKTAQKNISYFEKMTQYGLHLLEIGTTPPVNIGKHCFKPGLCEFASSCFPENLLENPHNIFNAENLSLEEKLESFHRGIYVQPKNDLMPEVIPENDMWLELKQTVKEILNGNPVFFDMEFFNGPVPFLDGHRPFDNVCVAFDIFIAEKNKHQTFFLEEPNLKCLEHIIHKLITLLSKSDLVVTFDKKMEYDYAVFLSSFFPKDAVVFKKIMESSVDLQHLIRKKSQGLPVEFRNLLGLKKLSDALGYDKHKKDFFNQGFDALMGYEKYMSTHHVVERKSLRNAIKHYVQGDTERMHFICQRLLSI
jgi:hypothetical protein